MDEFLWYQKYRPKTLAECNLTDSMKEWANGIVSKGRLPSMIFYGPPGGGKTTLALALCNDVDADVLKVNGSKENGIDTLRTKISQFAFAASLTGSSKVVLIDEAENLTGPTQEALRAFIEEVSKATSFILTANVRQKIIPALQSRCTPVEFVIPSAEKPKMAKEFLRKVESVLKQEGIEYDRRAAAEIISRYFPDYRRTYNELQRLSVGGVLGVDALASITTDNCTALIEALKGKKFQEMRKWVANNAGGDLQGIYTEVYKKLQDKLEPQSFAEVILILADYSFKAAFVADPEINMTACFYEVMKKAAFK